jgi:hypothetical protein
MGHPTSFLPREIDMSATPKTPRLRTDAQKARNKKQADAVVALKAAGLSAAAPYIAAYIKMENSGKSKEEIIAALKPKQNANAATRKAAKNNKKATKTTVKANNKSTGNATPATTVGNQTPKVKSNKKAAANKAQANTGQKFKNHGLKAYPKAVSYYITQKKAGLNNDAIFEAIKGMPNLQLAPIRTKKNNTAAVAVVAPLGNAQAVVAMNKGVAKGSYVCEKCRLVANNTRKNNKKNNYTSNNYFPVNNSNF